MNIVSWLVLPFVTNEVHGAPRDFVRDVQGKKRNAFYYATATVNEMTECWCKLDSYLWVQSFPFAGIIAASKVYFLNQANVSCHVWPDISQPEVSVTSPTWSSLRLMSTQRLIWSRWKAYLCSQPWIDCWIPDWIPVRADVLFMPLCSRRLLQFFINIASFSSQLWTASICKIHPCLQEMGGHVHNTLIPAVRCAAVQVTNLAQQHLPSKAQFSALKMSWAENLESLQSFFWEFSFRFMGAYSLTFAQYKLPQPSRSSTDVFLVQEHSIFLSTRSNVSGMDTQRPFI